jgi:hypothetical protein
VFGTILECESKIFMQRIPLGTPVAETHLLSICLCCITVELSLLVKKISSNSADERETKLKRC